MRRVYLRGQENILKRPLVHVAGTNLGLLIRKASGVGTPRSLQGQGKGLGEHFAALWSDLVAWACSKAQPWVAGREMAVGPSAGVLTAAA